jgi:dihydroorotate dehydrogenase (fumarate)
VRLDQAGADGLVLFNRFMQPDIHPEKLDITAGVELSSPAEARLPRTWIALLAGRVSASLAATTGVEDATDVAKHLLAGADVVMTASALLRHGPAHATVLLDGLSGWMARRGADSVTDLRGLLAVPAGTAGAGDERSRYVTAVQAADAGRGSWAGQCPGGEAESDLVGPPPQGVTVQSDLAC